MLLKTQNVARSTSVLIVPSRQAWIGLSNESSLDRAFQRIKPGFHYMFLGGLEVYSRSPSEMRLDVFIGDGAWRGPTGLAVQYADMIVLRHFQMIWEFQLPLWNEEFHAMAVQIFHAQPSDFI